MTRLLETSSEDAQEKRDKLVLFACNGGLLEAVLREGGILKGFSFKVGDYDCLMTIRADFPAGPKVTFVDGDDLAYCLRKSYLAARNGRLRWREDQFAPA